jgi:hypothetical protein
MSSLRESLSFGFEQTFTTPDWWTDPGFVATSNTPLKLEKMKLLAENLARVMSGRFVESQDIYKHLQYETFDAQGLPSFVVTMDPGSIEVKSPPLFIAGMEDAMKPLFEAAYLSGLVAYRNWWYGVKTGTEGGCHVNMAGLTAESNPLRQDPRLVVQYAAFFHNNPWIHYPFMGVDVGPGGNCMRMDEHALDPHSKHAPGALDSMERFAALSSRINRGERPTAEQVAAHFKGSKLADDKHSAPSFYKFKAPLFFVEDRAVEALRGADEFFLVSDLRLRILEALQPSGKVEALRDFGSALHREMLASAPLWRGFREMCTRLEMDAEPYRRFFDRQFPRLMMGQDVPSQLEVREGRRPRVITDVQMRGDLIISKTVDTSFARLELLWAGDLECVINGRRYEAGEVERDGAQVRCVLLDYQKMDQALEIALVERGSGRVVEKARFHPKDMMFKTADFDVIVRDSAAGAFYFNAQP